MPAWKHVAKKFKINKFIRKKKHLYTRSTIVSQVIDLHIWHLRDTYILFSYATIGRCIFRKQPWLKISGQVRVYKILPFNAVRSCHNITIID